MTNNDLSTKGKSKNKVAPLAGIAVLVLFPLLMNGINFSYAILLACYIELYFIAVSGLDLLFGYCGQINMGLAGFFAIGAYGSGMLHNFLGIPVLFSMIIAAIIAAFVGALLAYPCSKLQFHFLTLATIAFGEIVNQLLSHSPGGVTGNFNGLFSDKVSIFGYELKSYTSFYIFGLICVAVFSLIKHNIVKSKIGRSLEAIRDNSHAANGMGIDVRKYKILAFGASALFTGFAGGMYMHLVGFVSPDTFTQKQSVMFLTMLLFGGVNSFGGSVLGVVLLTLLTEIMRNFTGYQTMIYGALILIVVLVIPGGVYRAILDFFRFAKTKLNKSKGVG